MAWDEYYYNFSDISSYSTLLPNKTKLLEMIDNDWKPKNRIDIELLIKVLKNKIVYLFPIKYFNKYDPWCIWNNKEEYKFIFKLENRYFQISWISPRVEKNYPSPSNLMTENIELTELDINSVKLNNSKNSSVFMTEITDDCFIFDKAIESATIFPTETEITKMYDRGWKPKNIIDVQILLDRFDDCFVYEFPIKKLKINDLSSYICSNVFLLNNRYFKLTWANYEGYEYFYKKLYGRTAYDSFLPNYIKFEEVESEIKISKNINFKNMLTAKEKEKLKQLLDS